MQQKQKEAIASLLEKQAEDRDFKTSYLIEYREYLDSTDAFTEFNCERAEGKEQYAVMIEQVRDRDRGAKVFVAVYGLEGQDEDRYIYADTLIILSNLSEEMVQEVIDQSGDIFPSEFSELNYNLENYFIIDIIGEKSPLMSLLEEGQRVINFWWD